MANLGMFFDPNNPHNQNNIFPAYIGPSLPTKEELDNCENPVDVALLWASRGVPVFPCQPGGDKAKAPYTKKGFHDATTDEAQIIEWWTKYPEALIASPIGEQGLVALDLDIKPEGSGIEQSVELEKIYNFNLDGVGPVARTQSGGLHIIMKAPNLADGLRANLKDFGAPQIDMKGGKSGYIILPGSVMADGQCYEWEGGHGPEVIAPQHMPDNLVKLAYKSHFPPMSVEELSSSNCHSGPTPEEIDAALKPVPADDYADWVLVGQILKGHSGESGFPIWDSWSQKSVKYDQSEMGIKWDTFDKNTGGVATIATIFQMYKQHGGNPSDLAKEHRGNGASTQSGALHTAKPSTEKNEPEPAGWPILAKAAKRGIVGDIMELACRNSEADPVAVMATTLSAVGTIIGRRVCFEVGDTNHYPILFGVLVGGTSRARKGTSEKPVKKIIRFLESIFSDVDKLHTHPGPLSTLEGIVYELRDADWVPDTENSGMMTCVDEGVEDKRIFVVDGEFGNVMRVSQRSGNTLSVGLRSLWDGSTLSPMTKRDRIRATDPHAGIIGHITNKELNKLLIEGDSADIWNGFANRFLWFCVRRQKLVAIPSAMPINEAQLVAERLGKIISGLPALPPPPPPPFQNPAPYQPKVMNFSTEAAQIWIEMYPKLTQDYAGVFGAVTCRIEAQAIRLALIYAVLDEADEIRPDHLGAAIAVCNYVLDSARYIFGESNEDPTANKIAEALKASGCGMTTTELHKAFSGHISSDQLKAALHELQGSGKVSMIKEPTKGAPRKIWKFNIQQVEN